MMCSLAGGSTIFTQDTTKFTPARGDFLLLDSTAAMILSSLSMQGIKECSWKFRRNLCNCCSYCLLIFAIDRWFVDSLLDLLHCVVVIAINSFRFFAYKSDPDYMSMHAACPVRLWLQSELPWVCTSTYQYQLRPYMALSFLNGFEDL